MTLSRILVATDFEMVLRPISKRWTTKFFVLGDIISFIMQGGGGGLLATAGREGNVNQYKMGENLILGGLGVQLMFLFGYMVTVVWCAWGLKRVGRNLSRGSQDIRLTGITDSTGGSHRLPSSDDEETAGGGFATAARLQIAHQGLVVLFVTSLLIFIRSVFRVIEYIQGHDGYLMRHEVWLYIFDGTIILAVVAVFCWWYPTEMLRTVGGDVKITGKRRVDGTEKRRRRG